MPCSIRWQIFPLGGRRTFPPERKRHVIEGKKKRSAKRALYALDSRLPVCVKTPKIQSRTKKFPTGMANIRQKPHEIPTQPLVSYDFDPYFPTLQKARMVFTQTAAREWRIRITPPLMRGSRQDEGASPKSRRSRSRAGGGSVESACYAHRPGEPQGPPTPHRGSRRLAACLLRLPLRCKGGVMRMSEQEP